MSTVKDKLRRAGAHVLNYLDPGKEAEDSVERLLLRVSLPVVLASTAFLAKVGLDFASPVIADAASYGGPSDGFRINGCGSPDIKEKTQELIPAFDTYNLDNHDIKRLADDVNRLQHVPGFPGVRIESPASGSDQIAVIKDRPAVRTSLWRLPWHKTQDWAVPGRVTSLEAATFCAIYADTNVRKVGLVLLDSYGPNRTLDPNERKQLEKMNIQVFDNSKSAAKYFQTSWEDTTPKAVATFSRALNEGMTRSTLKPTPLNTTRITSISQEPRIRVSA